MFSKSLIITTFFVLNLNAQTIESIVNSALLKNYSLKAIESSINIAKEQISLASKWNNPILSFGATDLQFNDITKRDKEAMQSQFIGLTQDIPLGNKLEIEKNIAIDDFEISKFLLENKKLELKSIIYEYAYNIKLLEEKISLFEEFKSNSLKLESLLKELYKYNKATQEQIIQTQILYKEISLNSQKMQTILNTLKLKLEGITYEKIKTINFNTKIKPTVFSSNIDNHPKILEFVKNKEKFSKISELELAKKNSDIKINLSYFQRDSKFDDYINISFAIPLSFYGSENIKANKAKLKSLEINYKLEDFKINFKNRIKILQQNLNDSITTFNIIENDIIPKYNELQNILENYNKSTLYKNIDSRTLIKNQNELIKYKLKAIDEKEKYFTTLAKSYYFSKEN